MQPNQLNDVLNEIKYYITPKRHTVVSVVTGRKIAQIEEVLGEGVSIVRSMPNTAISVGQSMTCLSANENGKKKNGQRSIDFQFTWKNNLY